MAHLECAEIGIAQRMLHGIGLSCGNAQLQARSQLSRAALKEALTWMDARGVDFTQQRARGVLGTMFAFFFRAS